jgi:hypothetical protein
VKKNATSANKRMSAKRGQHGTHAAERAVVKITPQNPSMETKPSIDVQRLAETPEMKAYGLKMLAESTGVQDPDLAARMLEQVGRIQAPWLFGDIMEGQKVAIEMMREMRPGTLVEGMLSQQMIGVHCAGLSYLQKAAYGGEQSESYLARATRLMRLFHEQAEAMAKLKGRVGQQKMIVKHIHVHEGGQAIVGPINAGKLKQGGGGPIGKSTKTP